MVIRNELITRCDLYTRYMVYIERQRDMLQIAINLSILEDYMPLSAIIK